MTNEQKTLFLLKIPYINLFKLQKIYNRDINLIGGNPNQKENMDNIDYGGEYNNNTGNSNIDIDDNKYHWRVERYSTGEGTKFVDIKFKFIDFITIL